MNHILLIDCVVVLQVIFVEILLSNETILLASNTWRVREKLMNWLLSRHQSNWTVIDVLICFRGQIKNIYISSELFWKEFQTEFHTNPRVSCVWKYNRICKRSTYAYTLQTHTMSERFPLILCIWLQKEEREREKEGNRVSLQVADSRRERRGMRVLGDAILRTEGLFQAQRNERA